MIFNGMFTYKDSCDISLLLNPSSIKSKTSSSLVEIEYDLFNMGKGYIKNFLFKLLSSFVSVFSELGLEFDDRLHGCHFCSILFSEDEGVLTSIHKEFFKIS